MGWGQVGCPTSPTSTSPILRSPGGAGQDHTFLIPSLKRENQSMTQGSLLGMRNNFEQRNGPALTVKRNKSEFGSIALLLLLLLLWLAILSLSVAVVLLNVVVQLMYFIRVQYGVAFPLPAPLSRCTSWSNYQFGLDSVHPIGFFCVKVVFFYRKVLKKCFSNLNVKNFLS